MTDFTSQTLHIQTTIQNANAWKIEQLNMLVRSYYRVVAKGWGHREAWFLYGVRIARLMGYSVTSRMPREEFVRTVAEALDANVAGLEALVQLTGASPWAVAMLYILGA